MRNLNEKDIGKNVELRRKESGVQKQSVTHQDGSIENNCPFCRTTCGHPWCPYALTALSY